MLLRMEGVVQHLHFQVLCAANHFLCSCACDMDHESAIKYYYMMHCGKYGCESSKVC